MIYLLNILLLFLAFKLRTFGINWDGGAHLHPDERMLIMVAERINFFDKLNPEFFNYGSLPIYILRGTTQFLDLKFGTHYSNYDGMLNFGRHISIFFDLATILVIYKLALLLFKNKKTALFSAFFYTIAFFPIQNTHFFVVDVFLNFFITLLSYLVLSYISLPTKAGQLKTIILMGVIFAAAITTKFTSILFYPFVLFTIVFREFTVKHLIRTSLPKKLLISLSYFLIFNLAFLIFCFVFMPYAFITYTRFISDIKEQIRMSYDPYIFPYTLQYVATLPYLYYLKNIFLWGLGPIISILSLTGLINIVNQFLKNKMSVILLLRGSNDANYQNNETIKQWINRLVFLLFYAFYFLIIGRTAVKFMRYMLPLYPFFSILAGYGFTQIKKSNSKIKNFVVYGLLTLATLWTLMFVNIYSQKHTRIEATTWIHSNIPYGSTIALEHWDDGLPLYGIENYQVVELPLYERPDNNAKWTLIEERLNQADYLIIASNRLYAPLQKLVDCDKFIACYPKTADYYKKLFSGQRQFVKVAEFSSNPGFYLANWKFAINDQSADESFTVYDHPKIMIFRKNK